MNKRDFYSEYEQGGNKYLGECAEWYFRGWQINPVEEFQSLTENLAEKLALIDDSLSETEKKYIQSSRTKQGIFRDRQLALWKKCPITGIVIPALLVASHIKPWANCTNPERLDPENTNTSGSFPPSRARAMTNRWAYSLIQIPIPATKRLLKSN